MTKKQRRDDWFMICAEHKTCGVEQFEWRCVPSEIDRIKHEKLATGFRVWIDPTRKDLDRCLEGDDGVMVDFWLHMPRAQDYARKHNLPLKEYVDQTVDMLLDYMKKYGNRVWWTLYGEHDNHIRLPQKYATRQEAYEYMKAVMTTSRSIKDKVYFPGASPTVHCKDMYNGMPQPFEYIKQRGISFKKANIAVQCGLGTYSHYIYEWGPKLIWMETNCGLPNMQIELAFLHGAARQHDKYFGIDMSSWGGSLVHLTTVYDKDGSYIAGTHPSIHLRQMLVAFLTGTNMFHQEMTEISFWIDRKLGTGVVHLGHDHGRPKEYFYGIEELDVSRHISPSDTEWFQLGKRELELSPTGKVSQQMVDFGTKRYPELRKHPYKPIALLMEYYHGWSQRYAHFNQVCFGNNEYETGDYMVKAFFGTAFPGYLQKAHPYDRIWASGLVHGRCSSGDVHKEMYRLVKSGYDPRSTYDIELVSSRWGDVFDVILENVSLEILVQYPMIVLFGRIVPAPALEKSLWQYMQKGGVVFASVANLSRRFLTQLGLMVKQCQDVSSFQCLSCGARFAEKRFSAVPLELNRKNLKILATAHDGYPLLVERAVGKGKIIISAVPYGLVGDNSDLLEGIKHLLDHLFSSVMPVEIQGKPIQWLINMPPSGPVVTLINNSAEIWKGKVLFKNAEDIREVRELWTETPVSFVRESGKTQLNVSIEPFGFKVLGTHCSRSKK